MVWSKGCSFIYTDDRRMRRCRVAFQSGCFPSFLFSLSFFSVQEAMPFIFLSLFFPTSLRLFQPKELYTDKRNPLQLSGVTHANTGQHQQQPFGMLKVPGEGDVNRAEVGRRVTKITQVKKPIVDVNLYMLLGTLRKTATLYYTLTNGRQKQE